MIAPTLYCPRIIGRDAELSTLLRLAADAAAGNSSVVLLSGEAGIGKTRLLDEFRAWGGRRATLAAVSCPAFAPVPLGPIVGILESIAPETSAERIAGAAPAMGQIKVFQQFSDLLRTAARPRPVVVTIDDAHWADTATLEFVHFAARELADARVMIVLAYRAEVADEAPAMTRAASRISRLRNVHEIRLPLLEDVAIAEMLAATLGPERPIAAEILRDVRDRAEGNPLFAEELLKSALESGVRQAPTTLQSLVAERVARMPEGEQRLLELAALIGRRFNATFLERVAESATRADVIAFLRSAVRRHLLIEDRADIGWFHFRHALVRDVILERILALEARRLHLAIGSALEAGSDADDRASELSEHFWQAAAKAECARYARIAGMRARERFAFRESAEQFERAIACVENARDLELHEGAAMAHLALGNVEAIHHHEVASQIAFERSDYERAVNLLLGLSGAKHLQRDAAGAYDAIDRAEEIEQAHPDPKLRLRILVQRAQLGMARTDFKTSETALSEAEGLLEWARPLDECRFLMIRAFQVRDARLTVELLERAVEIANDIADPRIVLASTGNLALGAAYNRPAGVAVKRFEETLAAGERYGSLHHALATRAHIANARIQAGRLEDARADLRMLLGEPLLSPLVQAFRAEVALRLAVYLREDELAQRADAAGVFERAAGEHVGYWDKMAVWLADYYACNGDAPAAQALIARLVRTKQIGEDEYVRCRLLPSIAALGLRQDVVSVQAEIVPWRASENPIALAHLALFDAYVAARFGDTSAAPAFAADAVRRFAELEMPLREAEAETLAGNATRAAALMKACGARRLPRQAETSSKAGALAKPLTAREREIATLAAAGKSSQAIAEQLLLSVRTVEAHLASAYSKLGVNSRATLGAALEAAL